MRISSVLAATFVFLTSPVARADEAKPVPTMSMQEHRQEMRRSMAELQKTTDPAKRQALLREHMAQMRAAMKDMHGMCMMCGGGGMHGEGMHGEKTKSGQGAASPDARLNAMHDRQDAMEWMLDEMLEHEHQMMQPTMKD